MLISLLALTLCGQAPTSADVPIRVAVPALQVVNGDEKMGDAYAGHLAQQLFYRGVTVVTPTEIAALLGLERQRQLLGCPDDSCKANLMAALGVDGLLVGRVTKLERSYQLDVRILQPGDGMPLSAASANTEDQDRLVGVFPVIAAKLAQELSAKLNRKLDTKQGSEVVLGASRVKRLSWVPLAAGVVAGGVGAVFLVMARGAYNDLRTPRTFEKAYLPDQASAVARQGAFNQTLGWTLVGVGGACVAVAALMFFLGGNDTVQTGIALTPGGVQWGLSGVWP